MAPQSFNKKRPPVTNQAPYRQAILLGFGAFGINLIWPLFNTFVPLFLARLGLSATLIGFIMTWDNYFNTVGQPLIGRWSDRTRTRLGRRKPWLLAGAPLAAIFFAVIPLFSSMWGIMAVILLTNIGMALFRSPIVALMGDIFPARQRSKANGIINLIGGTGMVAALVGGGTLYKSGQTVPFIVGGIVMLIAVSTALLWVQEPEPPPPEPIKTPHQSLMTQGSGFFKHDNRPLLTILFVIFCWSMGFESVVTWISSFAKFTLDISPDRVAILLGLSFVLPALIFAIPSGLLATRFGRKQTMLAGFLIVTLFTAAGWYVYNVNTLVIVLVLAGTASALISVNMLPLVYDMGHSKRIGALTGLYYLAINSGAIIGPQIIGFLIDLTGKDYHILFLPAAFFMAMGTLLLTQIKPETD